jgi:hypothetical protein
VSATLNLSGASAPARIKIGRSRSVAGVDAGCKRNPPALTPPAAIRNVARGLAVSDGLRGVGRDRNDMVAPRGGADHPHGYVAFWIRHGAVGGGLEHADDVERPIDALTMPSAFAASVKALQGRFLSVSPCFLSDAPAPRRNRAVRYERL